MKLVHLALAATLAVGLSGLSCSSPNGGDDGSGGHNGSGGSSSSGGSNGSGGSSGSGGSGSGGKVGSGGSSSSGGATGSGGTESGSGGKVGSGGSSSSGGATGSGGTTGSGGAATGGSGTTASGGMTGGGGTSAGGGAGGHVAGGGGHVGSGGAAGGSSGGGGSSGTGTFAAVATLLGTNCATSMCHDGTAHVSLKNDSGLYMRIVNGMPNGSMTESTCKTKTLITPNDTANSVISQIVKGAVTGCSDGRMPNMCSTTSSNPRACLTMAQIATIDSWITAGAPM